MKKGIFLLLFIAVIGAIVWRYYQRVDSAALGERVQEVADKTGDAAAGAKDAVAGKTEDWKLTAENIKDELARTGRVVRSKAKVVGERIDDARIIAVIKGKYVMDKDLSVLAVSVDCRDGEVKLGGSASSEQLIARAVALALQTRGVRNVVSLIVVKN